MTHVHGSVPFYTDSGSSTELMRRPINSCKMFRYRTFKQFYSKIGSEGKIEVLDIILALLGDWNREIQGDRSLIEARKG